ncbi:MAG: hypothetical protein JW840_08475 [Candidatus Thermoplasmatota archaeon]|nr:hypothetical protein [Candidatus Thermoplasmatota archaeon]
MTEKINLNEIEKKTYDFYNQDGLIDLIIGSMIFFIILCFFAEMIWLAGAFILFILPIFTVAKQKITAPRIGQVKFGIKGRHKTLSILLMIIGNIFLIFFLGLFIYRDNIPSWIFETLESYPTLIIGGIATFLLIISGILFGIKRFYYYGGILLIIFCSGQLFAINLLILALAVGTIFLLAGAGLFIRFIYHYPISHSEAKDAKY